MKQEYIMKINKLMENTDNIAMLNLVYQLLKQAKELKQEILLRLTPTMN